MFLSIQCFYFTAVVSDSQNIILDKENIEPLMEVDISHGEFEYLRLVKKIIETGKTKGDRTGKKSNLIS